MNLFVGSLSFRTTEEELQKEFEAFGEVESVKIILDQTTLKSRGFAFVTMPNNDQAAAAIAGLNGKVINGFTLKVNEARPKESRGRTRESSGPGFVNENRSGSGFGPRTSSRTGGYSSGRGGKTDNNRDGDIYDKKNSRSGSSGHGRKGRGSSGRSGGGKNSY